MELTWTTQVEQFKSRSDLPNDSQRPTAIFHTETVW